MAHFLNQSLAGGFCFFLESLLGLGAYSKLKHKKRNQNTHDSELIEHT
jgi:hypothetical protein